MEEVEAEAASLDDAWRFFCRVVANHSRFLFWHEAVIPVADHGAVRVPPAEMLRELGRAILLAGLAREIPAGTMLHRARLFAPGAIVETTAAALGPPPRAFAQANRMSAAGISMFYGAFEPETAAAEVAGAGGTMAVVPFLALRPLR